jgi:hypothetical protein
MLFEFAEGIILFVLSRVGVTTDEVLMDIKYVEYLQVVTTNNYSTIADFHILQITTR